MWSGTDTVGDPYAEEPLPVERVVRPRVASAVLAALVFCAACEPATQRSAEIVATSYAERVFAGDASSPLLVDSADRPHSRFAVVSVARAVGRTANVVSVKRLAAPLGDTAAVEVWWTGTTADSANAALAAARRSGLLRAGDSLAVSAIVGSVPPISHVDTVWAVRSHELWWIWTRAELRRELDSLRSVILGVHWRGDGEGAPVAQRDVRRFLVPLDMAQRVNAGLRIEEMVRLHASMLTTAELFHLRANLSGLEVLKLTLPGLIASAGRIEEGRLTFELSGLPVEWVKVLVSKVHLTDSAGVSTVEPLVLDTWSWHSGGYRGLSGRVNVPLKPGPVKVTLVVFLYLP